MLGIILGILLGLLAVTMGGLGWYLGYKNKKRNDDIDEKINYIIKDFKNKHTGYGLKPATEEEIKENATQVETLHKQKKKSVGMYVSLCICIVSVFMFIFIPFSIRKVDATEIAVLKVWGEAKEVRTSGTHFNSWISTNYVYYPISTQEIKNTIQAYSQDAQAMDAQLVVQYKINAEDVIKIAKEYGDNKMLKARIQSIVEERAKSVLSKKQAMAIIETRSQLSADILAEMDGVFDKYYVTITNVIVNDIEFSEAFEQAVENKMIAEQEQLKAEYEKEKKITEAEALLEVAKKEAEASIEKSKGDAEALKIMQEAWDALSSDVKQAMLQQMAIEKWNGELPETMVGTEFLEWLMSAINSTPTP